MLPSFSENYKNRVWKGQVMLKKQERSGQDPQSAVRAEWTDRNTSKSPAVVESRVTQRPNGAVVGSSSI